MTTGKIDDFFDVPEDINQPKPSYFHDVFHLVHAYIDLLHHVPESAVPGKGLVVLYSHRLGVLDIDIEVLQNSYLSTLSTNRLQQSELSLFAQSSIAFNITTLFQLLSNTIMRDIERGFGDDKCLSSRVIHALDEFCKLQDRSDTERIRRYDSMDAVVQACHNNAFYFREGISSTPTIIRVIETLDQIMACVFRVPDNTTQRVRLLNALKIIFYIGCRYYHLNLLRFSDEMIKRSYDRSLDITDLTLASVPFDPMLFQTCADDTSSISRWGIEYVQSLETVLLYFGGVRYAPTFTIEANGNRGSVDV